jgi:hypothetical protein
MKLLLFSGLLYLSGIALILWFRPQLMFHENGTWKEFGIGRGDKYTWLPFWLFAITWAMMSYIIILTISGIGSVKRVQEMQEMQEMQEIHGAQPFDIRPKRLRVSRPAPAPAPAPAQRQELLPGYYMLNTPSINERGVPRYVFIGEQLPGQY